MLIDLFFLRSNKILTIDIALYFTFVDMFAGAYVTVLLNVVFFCYRSFEASAGCGI